MNILIVSQYFWPESFRINDIALGLQQKGHKVSILTGLPNYPGGTFFTGFNLFSSGRSQWHGTSIYRVPVFPRCQGKSWQLALNCFSFAFAATLSAPFLCREKFDVIFVFEPSPVTVALPALFLRMVKGVPVILWVQDLWPESLSATGVIKSKLVLGQVKKLVRFIYTRCDLILVQSRAFINSIKGFGIDEDRIFYFPNSADEIYEPINVENDAPESRDVPAGFTVMFAGNIGDAQDFNTLLSAAEVLKGYSDIHWIILGDGRKFSWVKEQIAHRSLENCFHLLGRHPVESMPRYFALADVMLVSLKKEEIFSLTIPSKVQSYLACGRPIVASLDGEGGRVIEESGAGLVVGAEQPDKLADAVLKFYKMTPQKRENMGRLGIEYFKKHFEKEKLLDNLNRWMRDLTDQA